MNISLSPDLAKFLDEEVKAGRFASTTQAIEAGIARLMLDQTTDILDEQDLTDIRASLDEMDRGEVTDAGQFNERMRKRYLNG